MARVVNKFHLMGRLHVVGSGFLGRCVKKASEAEFNPQEEVLLSSTDCILGPETGRKGRW